MGDLCSLSEHDVHQLPIRVPKIASLRKVMAKYQDKLRKQKLVDSDMGQCRLHAFSRLNVLLHTCVVRHVTCSVFTGTS